MKDPQKDIDQIEIDQLLDMMEGVDLNLAAPPDPLPEYKASSEPSDEIKDDDDPIPYLSDLELPKMGSFPEFDPIANEGIPSGISPRFGENLEAPEIPFSQPEQSVAPLPSFFRDQKAEIENREDEDESDDAKILGGIHDTLKEILAVLQSGGQEKNKPREFKSFMQPSTSSPSVGGGGGSSSTVMRRHI